jgi:hypothetical protein
MKQQRLRIWSQTLRRLAFEDLAPGPGGGVEGLRPIQLAVLIIQGLDWIYGGVRTIGTSTIFS